MRISDWSSDVCSSDLVIAWMAAVFYLPRILVNLAEAGGDPGVRARLVLMGRRLYRFGHVMFGLATVLGLALWLGYRLIPDFPTMVGTGTGWLHAKLALVVLLLAHFIDRKSTRLNSSH